MNIEDQHPSSALLGPQAASTDGMRRPSIERYINAAAAISYRNEYLRLSTTLTYSYIFALPLIILYEIGLMVTSGGAPTVRIGADVWIRSVLGLIGLDTTLLLGVVLLLAGAAIFLYERRHNVPIRPRYFGFMFGESLVYAFVVGSLVAAFVGSLFAGAALQMPGGTSMMDNLVLSLGAGIYEELVFRLILVTGLYVLLRAIPIPDAARYGMAAVIGALIFSAVHYIGELGYDFTLASFVFRFLMGLALNGLFIFRGFGIAAMTHALYDVIVTVST